MMFAMGGNEVPLWAFCFKSMFHHKKMLCVELVPVFVSFYSTIVSLDFVKNSESPKAIKRVSHKFRFGKRTKFGITIEDDSISSFSPKITMRNSFLFACCHYYSNTWQIVHRTPGYHVTHYLWAHFQWLTSSSEFFVGGVLFCSNMIRDTDSTAQ